MVDIGLSKVSYQNLWCVKRSSTSTSDTTGGHRVTGGQDPSCDSSSEVSDEGYKSSQGQVSLIKPADGQQAAEASCQLSSNVASTSVVNEKSSSSISKDSDVALSSHSSQEGGNGEKNSIISY